jgi:triphosphatase
MTVNETELKLALQPDDMARLRRRPLLQAKRHGKPQTRHLRSVYFDTPDFVLAKSGVCLRIRTSADGRRQTVKTAGTRASGLFTRREWEAPVASSVPDAALLRATGLELFADQEQIERLGPVFATDVRRTVYRLGEGSDDGWEVEVALDSGEISAGPAREAICEVEIELVRGRPECLFALARDLSEAVPVRLMALSKSDRGYQLAAGTPLRPVKTRPVPLEPGMTVAAGFQTIARGCLDHLLANERCLLANGDAEAVHQMRVALRRLRSAMKAFGRVVEGPQLAEARAALAWLLDHLGPARDAEVFLTTIVDPVAADHPGLPAVEALRADWLADKEAKSATALEAVRDRRFTNLLLSLGAWVEAGDWLGRNGPLLEQDLGPFAERLLAKSDKKLRRAGHGGLDHLTADELHRVRILGKQLRYTSEFFAAFTPRRATKAFLADLSALQDTLGQINDIAVAQPKLAAAQPDPERAWAAGLVTGWHEARRAPLLIRAKRAWKRWLGHKRPWRTP